MRQLYHCRHCCRDFLCDCVCVCVELRIVKGRFVFPIFAAAPCFSISSFKSLWPHASFSFLKTFLNTAITIGIWIIGQAYFQELQQWQYNNGLRTTQYLTSTGSACPVALGHRGCIRAGDAQRTSLGSPGQVLPLYQRLIEFDVTFSLSLHSGRINSRFQHFHSTIFKINNINRDIVQPCLNAQGWTEWKRVYYGYNKFILITGRFF